MTSRFQIGGLTIASPLVLAPMSGVTDSPFRRLVQEASGAAVGMVTTEFIPVDTLRRGAMKSLLRMAFHPSERPIAVQVFGANAPAMAEAARIIEGAGADMVDINAGCPAPKVVKKGGGAALLKDLPALGRMIEAVRGAVSIPVGVKIRNGWCEESLNAHEALRIAEAAGADVLAVHGRTRAALYRGEADWSIVRELAEEASIPVVGSGDIGTAEAGGQRLDETGCAAVMVGRAAIVNPWIFRDMADHRAGRTPSIPTWTERLALLERYRDLLVDAYPERMVPGRMKMMLNRLTKALPDLTEARLACLRAPTPGAMLDALRTHCVERGLIT